MSILANNSDFNYFGNHAKMSQRKVAELLKVEDSTVLRAINSAALNGSLEAETIKRQGFDGAALSWVLDYLLFDSKRVSKNTLDHCRSIYRQAAAKGFQDFIDAMAGLLPSQPKVLTSYDRAIAVNQLAASMQFFGMEIQNPRFKQGVQDLVGDMLGLTQPTLLATTETWLGVAERAEELGYSVQLVTKHRSQLGKYIKSCGLETKQEKRLCNGTQRPINLYLQCDELDVCIKEFMDVKVLAS